MFKRKSFGQGALEYLLLIGGALLVALVVINFLSQIAQPASTQVGDNFAIALCKNNQCAGSVDVQGKTYVCSLVSGDCTAQTCTGATDADGDLVLECVDNCPVVSNPLQENIDGDSKGDLCDDEIILLACGAPAGGWQSNKTYYVGAPVTNASGSCFSMLNLPGVSGVTIDCLGSTNSITNAGASGAIMVGVPNTVVKNCTISSASLYAVDVLHIGFTSGTGSIISNNSIGPSSLAGIQVRVPNVQVLNNNINSLNSPIRLLVGATDTTVTGNAVCDSTTKFIYVTDPTIQNPSSGNTCAQNGCLHNGGAGPSNICINADGDGQINDCQTNC